MNSISSKSALTSLSSTAAATTREPKLTESAQQTSGAASHASSSADDDHCPRQPLPRSHGGTHTQAIRDLWNGKIALSQIKALSEQQLAGADAPLIQAGFAKKSSV